MKSEKIPLPLPRIRDYYLLKEGRNRDMTAIKLLFFIIYASGCVSMGEGKEIKEDIYKVQARLVELEQSQSHTGETVKKTDDETGKRLASANAEMEKLIQEIQKMKGEIDSLKVGVMTGQLPGQEAAPEGSVAQTLSETKARLDHMEEEQIQIKQDLEDIRAKKKESAKDSGKKDKAGNKIETVDELEKAFKDKKYKLVAEEAQGVITKAKGDKKEHAFYLLGESLYKLGKFRESALEYNSLIEQHKQSKHVPLARLRMGDCFRQLGDPATAKIYYEEIVKKHPSTPEAQKAKEWLAKAG